MKVLADVNAYGVNSSSFSVHFYNLIYLLIEPPHDKTNKVTVRSAKTQISLGIRPVWSVFACRIKKPWVLSYPLSAQRRLWSDWADAQADLSLRWAHMPLCWFCHEAALISILFLTANANAKQNNCCTSEVSITTTSLLSRHKFKTRC